MNAFLPHEAATTPTTIRGRTMKAQSVIRATVRREGTRIVLHQGDMENESRKNSSQQQQQQSALAHSRVPRRHVWGSIFPYKTAKQEVFLRDPASLIRLANIIIVATIPLCKNSAKFINIQPLVGSHSPSSNALA